MRRVALAAGAVIAVAVALLVVPAAGAATWCGGTGESATDRPDTLAALTWHVIYAYPSDGVDRFPQLAGPIFDDLSAIDAWWRGQDPTRAIRWDLADFPGCGGGLAALDLSSVRLPRDGSWYRPGAARWQRLSADLAASGFGDPDKKFLAYYDGPLDLPLHECGISRTGSPESGGGGSYAVIYLGATCGDGLGLGVFPAVAAAHELTHTMDALVNPPPGQPGPPHACPGDPSHPCDSPSDLLYPSSQGGVPLASKLLDVGHDDYYGHSGPWCDVQDSPFLEHLDSLDAAPPGLPAGITARSSSRGNVEIGWQAAPDDVGPVSYEVLRDGVEVALTDSLTFAELIGDGETYTYLVRPRDAVGRLGPVVSLRYTGGLGIVDENGALLLDTVAPSPVARIRARLTRKALVLAWTPSVDAGGLAGYRVSHNGRIVATARGTTLSVWPGGAAGTWSVQPFDRAGNRGEVSPALTLAPRAG